MVKKISDATNKKVSYYWNHDTLISFLHNLLLSNIWKHFVKKWTAASKDYLLMIGKGMDYAGRKLFGKWLMMSWTRYHFYGVHLDESNPNSLLSCIGVSNRDLYLFFYLIGLMKRDQVKKDDVSFLCEGIMGKSSPWVLPSSLLFWQV